jgi:hypothetical protein
VYLADRFRRMDGREDSHAAATACAFQNVNRKNASHESAMNNCVAGIPVSSVNLRHSERKVVFLPDSWREAQNPKLLIPE